MTPQELETAIRERYNAVGDSFFSSTMVWDIIYQAQMQLATEAFVIERVFTTTSTSGTRSYAYPDNTMAIRKIEYDGRKIWPVGLDQDPKTSTTEITGRSARYALWNEEIILYPTPDTTGLEIKIYAYNNPQAVTSTSVLEVPDEYHLNIIDFALGIFYAKDGNLQMASYHRGLWEKAVLDAKRNTAKKKRGDKFVVVGDQEDLNFLNRDGFFRG